MRKNLIIGCVALLCTISVCAQNNSVNPDYSKSEDIIKTRRLLLDNFISNNKIGVRLETEQLMMLDDENYVALYPTEFWLLSYLTQDYPSILKTVGKADSSGKYSTRIEPPKDYLSIKLFEKTVVTVDSIREEIGTAPLSNQDKDFLNLFLKYLLSNNSPNQEELNALSTAFLENYPNADQSSFVRNAIRQQYKVARTGGAITVHGGSFSLNGKLRNDFGNMTAYGLSFDIVRNNWLINLDLTAGSGKTKTDLPIRDGAWPNGSKTSGGAAFLSVGRFLAESNRIAFAPKAGLGIFGIDASDYSKERPELKQAGIKTGIAGALGVVGDFRIKNKKPERQYFLAEFQIPFIRVSYDYILSPLNSRYKNYSGSIHKITLGVGLSARRVERVY